MNCGFARPIVPKPPRVTSSTSAGLVLNHVMITAKSAKMENAKSLAMCVIQVGIDRLSSCVREEVRDGLVAGASISWCNTSADHQSMLAACIIDVCALLQAS